MEGYPLLPARRENLAESERQKNGTHRKTKKKRTMIKKSGRKFLFPIGNARAGGRKKLPPRDVFFFSFPLLFCFFFVLLSHHSAPFRLNLGSQTSPTCTNCGRYTARFSFSSFQKRFFNSFYTISASAHVLPCPRCKFSSLALGLNEEVLFSLSPFLAGRQVCIEPCPRVTGSGFLLFFSRFCFESLCSVLSARWVCLGGRVVCGKGERYDLRHSLLYSLKRGC